MKWPILGQPFLPKIDQVQLLRDCERKGRKCARPKTITEKRKTLILIVCGFKKITVLLRNLETVDKEGVVSYRG